MQPKVHWTTGIRELEVAKWDARKISDFMEKKISQRSVCDKFIKELNDKDKKSLQDFKANPSTFVPVMFFLYKPEKGFPTNRGKIYFEATRHLLSERDRDKRISREPVLDGLTLTQKNLYMLI